MSGGKSKQGTHSSPHAYNFIDLSLKKGGKASNIEDDVHVDFKETNGKI